MRAGWVGAVGLLAAFLASCGSKEDASLFVYAQNPVVAKDATGAFPRLTGSVDVVFDLGKWSTGPVKVGAVTMRLFRGENTVILPRAKIIPKPGAPTVPFEVPPGTATTVSYTIGIDQMTDAEIAEFCTGGPVSVTGIVEMEGQAQQRVATTPVAPQGCP
jgi:hypothetical protein